MIFPCVNVIHLPEREDRKERFIEEFARQGVYDYKVWPGVRNIHATFAGISSAHKQIVSHAKRTGLEKILIAEDDLRFTSTDSFKFFLENEPADYDLYLASVYTGFLNEENIVSDFSGMTFYMIHNRFYDKFLSAYPMNHIDREMKDRGKFVVCNPFTVIQWTTFSDQRNEMINYSHLLTGRKLYNNANEK